MHTRSEQSLALVLAALAVSASGCSRERNAKPTTAQTAPPAAEQESPAEPARVLVFDCPDGVSFKVRTGPERIELWTPQSLGGKRLVLPHVRAASGARYEDGGALFWDKGDSALVEIDGRRFTDCRLNASIAP